MKRVGRAVLGGLVLQAVAWVAVLGAGATTGHVPSPRFGQGTNIGMFAQFTYLTVPIHDINGVHGRLHIANMRRPGTSTCESSFSRTSSSCLGTAGGNARSLQIVATYPASSQAAGAFVSIGYGTGCIPYFSTSCSLTPAVGNSWPEVVFYEGATTGGPYGSWGTSSQVVDSHHIFRVERTFVPALSAYRWDHYLNSTLVARVSNAMWYGYSAYLMERSGTQRLSLNQTYLFDMQRRQHGSIYSTYNESLLYDGASAPGCAIYHEWNSLIGDNIRTTGDLC